METVTETKGKKNARTAPPLAHELPVLIGLAIAGVDESPSNPRKTFTGIESLAEDVKLRGVLQPVLVRPSLGDDGTLRHELVFGARRFRAAKLAGLTEIPAMVRNLTDAEAIEIQIVENSKREDIHPLEEADGYRTLLERHGYSAEDIAAKVGKGIGTVLGRLKYCSLIPAARDAFLAGRLTAATALIVARIPQPELQGKALDEILNYDVNDENPTSRKDALWIVKTRFMLRLVDAPFDRADAGLVAGVPACADCPKRTGNQRALFDDVDDKDDLCTDPTCFATKRDAGWERTQAEAKAKGQAVLSEKEVRETFHSGFIRYDADYVDLAATNHHDTKGRTYKDALPKKANVDVVLARDENGVVHELVAKADFVKAAPKAGVVVPEKPTKSSSAKSKKPPAPAAKEKHIEARLALAEQLGTKAEKAPVEAFWRTLARALLRELVASGMNDDVLNAIAVRLAVPPKKGDVERALLPALAKLTGARARGVMVEMLAGGECTAYATIAEFRSLFGVKAPTAAKKTGKAKK